MMNTYSAETLTPHLMLEILSTSGLTPELLGDVALVRTPHFDLHFTVGEWLVARATWAGALSAKDYVRATVAINSAHGSAPLPRMLIDVPLNATDSLVRVLKDDAGDLQAQAVVVYPLDRLATQAQIGAFIAAAFDGGISLTRQFHALYPERSPRVHGEVFNVAVADEVPEDRISLARVANWFMDQGVEEVPFDVPSGVINFQLGDTPVDILLDDPELLTVRAVVELSSDRQVEATEVLHLCNRANIDSALSTSFMRMEDDVVSFVSQVSVPIRAGLNDFQLGRVLNDGVVGAVAQIRAVLHQLD